MSDFQSRITRLLIIQQLNFSKAAKKQFLRKFGKMGDKNFLISNFIWQGWQLLYEVRRDELIEAHAFFNKWVESAHLPLRPLPPFGIQYIDKRIGYELQQ